ncbi:MAG: tetratricopeptide repeat protein, partial [Tissierellia bacterium]|nr:tetratricopeptide repeat protein [Tissierellia bacterium]
EAKVIITEYEEIVKEDVDIYSIKGVIAMMEGDLERAEKVLKRGLNVNERNFDLLYNLGYLYQLDGQKELAIEYYKKALHNTKNKKYRNKVCKLLQNLGLNKEYLMVNKTKLKVAFFPYKVSMWDSLSTIYEAFAKDENCEVSVVPIPYYQLSQNQAIPTYEGERFPTNIPITHYSKYNLEEEKPDIIFVHNIYDQYNTITRVYEEYFTFNLKKYTDMLVYVPYHIASFFPPYGKNATYMMPSIKNVDKVILVGDFVRKEAIKDGIPESKLLTLGSPKLDSMINNLKKDSSYPAEWEKKLDGKVVYTLDTGCLYFVRNPFKAIEEITNILSISNANKNTALIWRPHPLTRISIMKYIPQLLTYYNNLTEYHIKSSNGFYNNVILDETDNYLYALNAADVLISGNGSLLGSFLLTGKKIIFLDEKMPKGSVIPSNAFYYFYNKKESWYELVSKINDGYDPLAKNRINLANRIYKNIDGSCGEKIYKKIKKMVLEIK